MICYNCGCKLSDKSFCTGCGVDVTVYKKIMYAANRMYNDGLEKAKVRDLSGAITSLRQCIKLNKNQVEARNLLGLVYFECGEIVDALGEWVISKSIRPEKNIADDYINMLQSNPGRLEAFNQTIKKYNLALGYCEQDSLDLAVIQLKKVVSMNSKYLRARQLLALLYIKNEEWDKARQELEKCLAIDANNTTSLRYMKEVMANKPTEEEKPKKRKEIITYQSGNDTVIQPLPKKEIVGLQTILNILIGAAIGIGIVWFLVVPTRVQQAESTANAQFKEASEALDAKTIEVTELTNQIESLTAEKNSLSSSLTIAEGANEHVEAATALIEATLMYINATGDEMAIAESLEYITPEYLENEASESFKALYDTLMGQIGETVSQNYYAIGYEAYRTEDYETAIENLAKAFAYDETDDEALYNLANAYNRSGDLDNALVTYQKVVELFPDTEKAKKAENYIIEIEGQ